MCLTPSQPDVRRVRAPELGTAGERRRCAPSRGARATRHGSQKRRPTAVGSSITAAYPWGGQGVMSEYQYYEFQAIDRPLSRDETAAVRALSTRATITPTRFVNEYQWGDFKGDPLTLMARYYDAHLYFANWGTHRLMLRLPRRLLDPQTARRYSPGRGRCENGVAVHAKGEHVILDFHSNDEFGRVRRGRRSGGGVARVADHGPCGPRRRRPPRALPRLAVRRPGRRAGRRRRGAAGPAGAGHAVGAAECPGRLPARRRRPAGYRRRAQRRPSSGGAGAGGPGGLAPRAARGGEGRPAAGAGAARRGAGASGAAAAVPPRAAGERTAPTARSSRVADERPATCSTPRSSAPGAGGAGGPSGRRVSGREESGNAPPPAPRTWIR